MSRRIIYELLLCRLAFSGCSREQLGLPRVHLEVASPNGEAAAIVRNHFEIDPPSQSLWLRPPAGKSVQLQRLGADQDWCNTIVWSADSSTVAFLVQDARLVVVDATNQQVILEKWLVDSPRNYPTQETVDDLKLSNDGSMATYERCPRRGGPCFGLEKLNIIDHRSKPTAYPLAAPDTSRAPSRG